LGGAQLEANFGWPLGSGFLFMSAYAKFALYRPIGAVCHYKTKLFSRKKDEAFGDFTDSSMNNDKVNHPTKLLPADCNLILREGVYDGGTILL